MKHDIKTTISKRDAWQAESDCTIGQSEEGERVLRLYTGKASRGGIWSHAQVIHKTEHGHTHLYGFGGPGDWSKNLSTIPGRVTENAIKEAHAKALEQFPDLLAAALDWYATGKNKGE